MEITRVLTTVSPQPGLPDEPGPQPDRPLITDPLMHEGIWVRSEDPPMKPSKAAGLVHCELGEWLFGVDLLGSGG